MKHSWDVVMQLESSHKHTHDIAFSMTYGCYGLGQWRMLNFSAEHLFDNISCHLSQIYNCYEENLAPVWWDRRLEMQLVVPDGLSKAFIFTCKNLHKGPAVTILSARYLLIVACTYPTTRCLVVVWRQEQGLFCLEWLIIQEDADSKLLVLSSLYHLPWIAVLSNLCNHGLGLLQLVPLNLIHINLKTNASLDPQLMHRARLW